MVRPAVPVLLGPKNEDADPIIPLLRAKCATPTSTTLYAVIVSPGGRIMAVREMTYIGGPDYKYEYQMVGPSGTQNFEVRHRALTTPVSGSWRISLFGSSTVWLPYNATVAEIGNAVEDLPDLLPGDANAIGSLTDSVNGVVVSIGNHQARIDYDTNTLHGFQDQGQNLRNAAGDLVLIETLVVNHAAGDLPNLGAANPLGYGEWGWYAVARRDGEYSNGSVPLKQADRSQTGTFWYSDFPTVNWTRPIEGQSFDGNAPLFEWAVTNETTQVPVAYEEINYVDNGDDESVFLWATAESRPSSKGPIPHYITPRDTSGLPEDREFRLPHGILRNSPGGIDRYRSSLRVTNAAGQETFLLRNYDIEYTPPAAVSTFTGTVAGNKSFIDLAWSRTGDVNFENYKITVQPDGETERTIFLSTDPDELAYRTLDFPFNVGLTYRHYVESVQAGQEQISVANAFAEQVTFSGTVVSETVIPRRVLVFPARRDREDTPESDATYRTPWGQAKPVIFKGKGFHRVLSSTFVLIGPGYETARLQREAVEEFYRMIQGGELLLIRDATGLVMPCFASEPDMYDDPEYNYIELSATFIEAARPEVVAS